MSPRLLVLASADLLVATAELVRRGYSEAGIDKLEGGNWLRVFRQVGSARLIVHTRRPAG